MYSRWAMLFIILLSAWTFSALMVTDLQSGNYLAGLLAGKVSLSLLPAICFIMAAMTSISVGSSWGTIAILTPGNSNTLGLYPYRVARRAVSTATSFSFAWRNFCRSSCRRPYLSTFKHHNHVLNQQRRISF